MKHCTFIYHTAWPHFGFWQGALASLCGVKQSTSYIFNFTWVKAGRKKTAEIKYFRGNIGHERIATYKGQKLKGYSYKIPNEISRFMSAVKKNNVSYLHYLFALTTRIRSFIFSNDFVYFPGVL